VLVFEDEISLSNTATVSYQWAPKGKQPSVICKQRNRERQTVFGSYNFTNGQITVSFSNKGNYTSFKKHLKKVLYEYKDAPKIIMVLDNVAYHHAKKLKLWLQSVPKLELFYLPPYSPNLNAVERAWWYMRKHITHHRYTHSLQERKISFWKMFSHFQKPNEELKNVCEINY
jgi:transposase